MDLIPFFEEGTLRTIPLTHLLRTEVSKYLNDSIRITADTIEKYRRRLEINGIVLFHEEFRSYFRLITNPLYTNRQTNKMGYNSLCKKIANFEDKYPTDPEWESSMVQFPLFTLQKKLVSNLLQVEPG